MSNQTKQIAAHDHYLARARRATERLNKARREIEDACAEISTIRGLAGEWDRWRVLAAKVRTTREKFEATMERRGKALAELNEVKS